MKVITNDRLIKRNSRIGQIATFAGLVVLVGGLIITFRNPAYASLSWVALIAGFGLSQVGLYFGNRWGRHPRPDELVDQGLKGLNDQYSIYHYVAPASHLLVGPSGLWVIMPYYQAGKIIYEKNRYKQKGGGFMQKYLRIFGQDGLGRPDLEASSEVEAIDKFIKKNIPDVEFLESSVALVFTNDKADLEVENAPVLTIPLKSLKSAVRKSAKEKPLSPDMIKQINELFA
jgi:hypothetical protein